MSVTLLDLPIELISVICNMLSYNDMNQMNQAMPKNYHTEITYLMKLKLNSIMITVKPLSALTCKSFFDYHRLRLISCFHEQRLDLSYNDIRMIFHKSTEIFRVLPRLVEKRMVKWLKKSDKMSSLKVYLYMYETKDYELSNSEFATRFKKLYDSHYNFNLIIRYEAPDKKRIYNERLPPGFNYMIPRSFGRRWQPPRSNNYITSQYKIESKCKCCYKLEDLSFKIG